MATKKETENVEEEETRNNPIMEEATEETSPPDTLQEMTELLKRTQANFENYKKQAEKRIEEMGLLAARDIILEILPAIDNFELALKNVPEGSNHEFVHGMELIYSQLFSILENQGITIIDTQGGKTFDPYFHEALLKVESEMPENTILQEFQKGFLLGGQVIRHAKVKISAGQKNNIKKNHNQEEIKNGK